MWQRFLNFIFDKSNANKITFVIVYACVCLISSILFIQCQEKRLQERISSVEAEKVHEEIMRLENENKTLKDVLEKANKTIEKTIKINTEEQEKHDRRVEDIGNDSAATSWLLCELPNSVRVAFKDYCAKSNRAASKRPNDSMQPSKGDAAKHE